MLGAGPGGGHTTGSLRPWVDRLTTVQIDPELADAVRSRFADAGNVEVVIADATELQDRLFREVPQVLPPGSVLRWLRLHGGALAPTSVEVIDRAT